MECYDGDEQGYKLILNKLTKDIVKLTLNSSYGIASNSMKNGMEALQLELESEQITVSEEEFIKDE